MGVKNMKKVGYILIGISIIILISLAMIKDDENNLAEEVQKSTTIQESISRKDEQQGLELGKNKIEVSDGDYNTMFIERQLYKFYEKINNKNFTEAYSMFNSEYINEMQVSQEYFKGIYDYSKTVVYQVESIEELSNSSNIVNLRLYSLDNVNEIQKKTFTIYSDGTMADMGIRSYNPMDIKEVSNNLEVSITNKIILDTGILLQLKMKNIGTQPILLKNGVETFQARDLELYNFKEFKGIPNYRDLQVGEEKELILEYKYVKSISQLIINLEDGSKVEININ
jgi:hypothetical protein